MSKPTDPLPNIENLKQKSQLSPFTWNNLTLPALRSTQPQPSSPPKDVPLAPIVEVPKPNRPKKPQKATISLNKHPK